MSAKVIRLSGRYRITRERIYFGDEIPEAGTYSPAAEYANTPPPNRQEIGEVVRLTIRE